MEETPRPLWAPWRVEFIRGEREKRCFLCDSDAPSGKPGDMLVIRRGRTAFVILNRYPYNAGHLLVSPYRHLADLPLLSEEERAEIFELCIQVRTPSTSASTSVRQPARECRTTCTCISCRAGTAIIISCRCWRTSAACRKRSRQPPRSCARTGPRRKRCAFK